MFETVASRALGIPELAGFVIVFTFHRETPRSAPTDCKTLVALTRVNKLLSEIALSHIWSALESATPLIDLLNPHRKMKPNKGRQHFSSLHDLARYVYYSKYVKAILFEEEAKEDILLLETADYFVMKLGWNNRHFQNLEHLGIRLAYLTDWPLYLAARSGPKFVSLMFTLDPETVNSDAIKSIGKQYPHLKVLRLGTPELRITRGIFRRIARPALENMPTLEGIEFYVHADVVVDLLLALRMCPKLEEINLVIDHGLVSQEDPEGPLPPRPNAESLMIFRCQTDDPRNLSVLFRISSALSMHYHSIDIVNELNVDEHVAAVTNRSLALYQPEASIVSVQRQTGPHFIAMYGIGVVDEEAYPISSATLFPLTQLRNLKGLTYDTCGPAMVTPALLDAIAQSCPNLHSCVLSPYRLPVSNEHMRAGEFLITIRDVIVFINCAKNLRHVGLAFDARKPEGLGQPVPPTINFTLEFLHVGGSTINNKDYVGQILATLPRLQNVVLHPPDSVAAMYLPTPTEMEMWSQVNRDYLLCRL